MVMSINWIESIKILLKKLVCSSLLNFLLERLLVLGYCHSSYVLCHIFLFFILYRICGISKNNVSNICMPIVPLGI